MRQKDNRKKNIKLNKILGDLEEMIKYARYEECLIQISGLMKNGNMQPELMNLLAKCYFFSGDYERALKWLENILLVDKYNADAYALLARIYFMIGHNKDAVGILEKMLLDNSLSISNEQRNVVNQMCELYNNDKWDKIEKDEEVVAIKKHLEVLGLLYNEGKDTFLAEKKRLESITIRKLRRKEKIKLAFALYDSSMWCGDELYHLFANDNRFDTVVYLTEREDETGIESSTANNWHNQIAEMKARGINVIPIREGHYEGWEQPDIFITMNPYDLSYPKKMIFSYMSFSTLLIYIPYACFLWDTKDDGERSYNIPVVNMAWKVFVENEWTRAYFAEHMDTGFPNGEASGWPRVDAYYREKECDTFKWKESIPDAKKIVYAPHWSINEGCTFATFQHNHDFFYKYARIHTEISWVLKPHPNLIHETVKTGVFANENEALRYFEKWDELPNAQVVMGGDYQKIFKSSDAMILDSCSFIEEYQYTGKPMLYLTRPEANFVPLALRILQNNYTVDGRDIYGIIDFIQNIVMNNNDFKKERRSAFFRKELDYMQRNGMLASQYIYNSITEDLFF